MADVFISYAHEDQAFVRTMAPALEAEGLSVWWDHTIPPGQTWDTFIARGIEEAKACIIIWSGHSVASDWVKEEATLAKDASKYLPVQIGADPPPVGFRRIQAANLTGWTGDRNNPQWQMLAQAAKTLARGETGERQAPRPAGPAYMAPPRPSFSPPPPQPPSASTGKPPIALLVGGVLAVAIVGLWLGTRSSDQAASTVYTEETTAPPVEDSPPATKSQPDTDALTQERDRAIAAARRAEAQAAASIEASRQAQERQRLALLDQQRANPPAPQAPQAPAQTSAQPLPGVWKLRTETYGSSKRMEGTITIEAMVANSYPCTLNVAEIGPSTRVEATETCTVTVSNGVISIKSSKVTRYTGTGKWNPDNFTVTRSGGQLIGVLNDENAAKGISATFSR